MNLHKWIARVLRAHRRKKAWNRFVRVVAAVVVFCTTYALILPAITLESGAVCGFVEHTHTDACYKEVAPTVCTVPETPAHTHTDECYISENILTCDIEQLHTHGDGCHTKTLSCGQEEYPEHFHSEDCYVLAETLICTEEHEHVGTCYLYESRLNCGMEETAGHSHTEACWEAVLTCQIPEGHTHGEDCYTSVDVLNCGMEEGEGHSHATDATDPVLVLVCGLEEHVHTDDCYPETEPTTQPETTVSADLTADVETSEDWEQSLSAVTLTGDWSADLLSVARSQLGYTQSSVNYITDEAGDSYGYTRYGQWYGDPYAPWSAMFVSFCLHYAQVEGVPAAQDSQAWLDTVNGLGMYRTAAVYTPVPGDLIFLDRNGDGVCEQTGIVECVEPATENTFGTYTVIAGNQNGRVDRIVLDSSYSGILGFAVLPVKEQAPVETTAATEAPGATTAPTEVPDETTVPTEVLQNDTAPTEPYSATGEDGSYAEVTLAEGSAVPSDAELTVTPIVDTDAQYAAMEQQLTNVMGRAPVDMRLLDISFYSAEGSYISVSDSAQVTVALEGISPGVGDVRVFHFVDGVPVALEDVSVQQIATAAEGDTASVRTMLSFQTEGFSVFAVTTVSDQTVLVTADNQSSLDGTYYILSYWLKKAIDGSFTDNYLQLNPVAGASDLVKHTKWKLESNTETAEITNDYWISDGTNYLALTGESALALVERTSASPFTVTASTGGRVLIKANDLYLNCNNYEETATGVSMQNVTDGGSQFWLYHTVPEYNDELTDRFFYVTEQNKNNLAGNYYILTYSAIKGAIADLQDNYGPKLQDVSDVESLSNLTVWTFDPVGDEYPNQYTISSSKGSLYMNTNVDSDGCPVTYALDGQTPTAFTVEATTDGRICISYNGFKLNSWGGEWNASALRGYNGNLDNGSKLRLCTVEASPPADESVVTDLHGKTFALVNSYGGVVRAVSDTSPESVANRLAGTEVSMSNGNAYVTGENVTLWTFQAVTEQIGTYNIVSDDGKYLYVGTYGVYVSETPEPIIVMESTTSNTVVLRSGTHFLRYYDGNFGPYMYDSNDSSDKFYLCEYIGESYLHYELNLPGLGTVSGDKSWVNTPQLTSENQIMEPGANKLFAQPNGYTSGLGITGEIYRQNYNVSEEENPYRNLYRMYVVTPNNLVSAQKPASLDYEEYRFEGWTYTENGTTYLLAPESEITVGADGTVTAADIDGNSVQIPSGTTLRGQWRQVSAPAYFFVNYTGTILDTEKDVAARSGAFLNGVAIGRVFFGTGKVGQDGTYALQVNEQISRMFTNQQELDLDPNGDHPTQLLIQTATTHNGENLINNPKYKDANSRMIVAAVFDWIQHTEGYDIKISTGSGSSSVDKSTINADNYTIRWYVMKEQYDAWHIDGVLTAVTDEVTVTKSFAGVDDATVAQILNHYAVDLWLGENTGSATYMTLKANSATNHEGQYTCHGYDSASKSIRWTVNVLTGENLTACEKDYTLDGYVVQRYSMIDGKASSMLMQDEIGYRVAKEKDNPDYDILGGTNRTVAYHNTYTKIGTATLTVMKKNQATGSIMQGVGFVLSEETENGFQQTAFTTNDIGMLDLGGLEIGKTYYLAEAVPNGFTSEVEYYKLVVSADETDSTHAKLTVYAVTGETETLLDSQTDTMMLTVENIPSSGTITVEKQFYEISRPEINNLMDSYQISLTAAGESAPKYVLKLSEQNTVANALLPDYVSADGFTYRWNIPSAGGKVYTVTESGYTEAGSSAYADVQVKADAKISGTAITLTPVFENDTVVGSPVSVEVNTTDAGVNIIRLHNYYTGEFRLYLQKRDSITQQPLEGAVFWLYGDYDESTDTSRTIRYRDENGEVKTLYFIGQTDPSGADGLARIEGLKLSNEGKTYAYVLSEIHAPEGYAKPSYPDNIVPYDQVIIVSPDSLTNNIFSTSMTNQTIGADLKIGKTVVGEVTETEFEIQITVSAPNSTARYENRAYTYNVFDANGTQKTNNVVVKGTAASNPDGTPAENLIYNVDSCTFTVTLKDGQYVVVKDVPIGYLYTVKELTTGDSFYPVIDNANGTGFYENATQTITGKVLLDETDDGNMLNTVSVTNYEKTATAKGDFTVTKNWLPADKAGERAQFTLYRVTGGDLTNAEIAGTVEVTAAENWTKTFADLPMYDDAGKPYDYYLAETLRDGYSVTYDAPLIQLQVEGQSAYAIHVTMGHITVTNTTGFELPATGGLPWSMILGIGLMLAVIWLHRLNAIKCKQQGGMRQP